MRTTGLLINEVVRHACVSQQRLKLAAGAGKRNLVSVCSLRAGQIYSNIDDAVAEIPTMIGEMEYPHAGSSSNFGLPI